MEKLSKYSSDDLPPAIKWQILTFMRVQWPTVFRGWNRIPRSIPAAQAEAMHFVVTDDDLLISHAMSVRLETEHQGRRLRIGGLGNVFTFPSLQGEGFGRRVVNAATKDIATSDSDIGALFCTPCLAGLYRKSGWEPMETTITMVGDAQRSSRSGDLLMMMFLSELGRESQESFHNSTWFIGAAW